MPRQPALPAKFPCWVKAIYSWSGETKQDLGFVEGDLIECLNAGDGQWWFGRLKRNHTVGLFPSNFVTLVEDPSRNIPRSSSPRPHFPSSAPNLGDSYVPPTPTPTSPPAPAPPPHRISYVTPSRSDSPSPSPPTNRTPTPVRSAMRDVMSSLDGMSVAAGDSPDLDEHYSATSFNAENRVTRKKSRSRPKSSIGFNHKPYAGFDHHPPEYPEEQRPPVLLTYSARLEERIKRMERSQSPQPCHNPAPSAMLPPAHAPSQSKGLAYDSGQSSRPPLCRTITMNSSSTAAASNVSGGTIFSTQTTSTAASNVSGFSASSAMSMARRKGLESGTGSTGVSLHALDLSTLNARGGLATLKSKRSGFFKRLLGSGKSSETVVRAKATPTDWTKVRRDVHRVNSLSQLEIDQRWEKVEIQGFKVLAPTDVLLQEVQGDEHADGGVVDDPIDVAAVNFAQVDKAVRFMATVPPNVGPANFAAGYLCRPYRSNLQCARAIFTFMSERMSWEAPASVPRNEDELDNHLAGVLQSRRGGSEELSWCVKRMCDGVGMQCEIVRGYLKTPGEIIDLEIIPKPNHFWNAMVIDGEWRIMDASLASPSNPRRALYTPASGTDNFYFLMKPSQAAFTHVPVRAGHQHLVPSTAPEVLLALPYACPQYFSHHLRMHQFNTSLTRMDGLEATQIDLLVPQDVECVAEVEVGAVAVDADGDVFDTGEVSRFPALAQAIWENKRRIYRIKALLPPGEAQGSLKVYAGKKGFMHSIKDNPHPLCLALPLFHAGRNEPFEFITRHPCPHAQRHDLYVAQPQCHTLSVNNTYVFSVRQHGSTPSVLSAKPAKLAIQSPGDKIMRIRCNEENGQYEMVMKVQETGVWRGLVLADRSARWCVFAEWTCA